MAQLLSKKEKLKRKRALKIKESLDKEIVNHNLRDVSSSETEDIDFSEVIHPIGYYIDDREQMIEEMFSITKGERLRKMLPPILKNCTLEELKADCLVHLLGMSKKRIFAILEGRELSSSSDSETDSEESSKELNKAEDVKRANSLNLSSNSDDDALSLSVSKKEMDFLTKDEKLIKKRSSRKKKSRLKLKTQIVKQEPTYSIVISDSGSDIEKKQHKNASKASKKLKVKQHKKRKTCGDMRFAEIDLSDVSEADEFVPDKKRNKESDEAIDKGKSLLEILELEMRARAIRALLQNIPNAEEPDPVSVINIKPESSEPSASGTQIGQTIADAIDNTLKEKQDTSETEVELIDNCDVDLCVTIDDDDDICIAKSPTPVIDITSPEKHAEPKNVSDDDNASTKNNEPENVSVGESSAVKDSEPKDASEIENLRKDAASDPGDNSKDDLSWSERWAESKNVKEIVKNSKICSNLRKRMRFARMLKQKQMQEDQSKCDVVVDFDNVEESSVAQYNLIKSLDKINHGKEETGESKSDDSRDEANNGVVNEELKETDDPVLNLELAADDCVIIESESKELNES